MSTPEDVAVIEAVVAAATPGPGTAQPGATQTPAAASATTAAPATPHCDNCGAAVAGRYCGNCGQRLEPPVHSLGHFMAVAFEDVTHADSRLWSTLIALLFKPGFLTHEFLAGRRARYLPPVRLYLVLSVAFFLWAAAARTGPRVIEISTTDNGVPKAAHIAPLTEATGPLGAPRAGETTAERNARECGEISLSASFPWHAQLSSAAQKACVKIRADNARSLDEAFVHNLPRAMFVFLPLLAASMLLLYRRPRHYYVEHLLLLVHDAAFIFLIVPLGWALRTVLPFISGLIAFALVLYIPWYMYRSLRVVYGQGGWLTFAKLLGIGFFYVVFSSLTFSILFIYSALTLQ